MARGDDAAEPEPAVGFVPWGSARQTAADDLRRLLRSHGDPPRFAKHADRRRRPPMTCVAPFVDTEPHTEAADRVGLVCGRPWVCATTTKADTKSGVLRFGADDDDDEPKVTSSTTARSPSPASMMREMKGLDGREWRRAHSSPIAAAHALLDGVDAPGDDDAESSMARGGALRIACLPSLLSGEVHDGGAATSSVGRGDRRRLFVGSPWLPRRAGVIPIVHAQTGGAAGAPPRGDDLIFNLDDDDDDDDDDDGGETEGADTAAGIPGMDRPAPLKRDVAPDAQP